MYAFIAPTPPPTATPIAIFIVAPTNHIPIQGLKISRMYQHKSVKIEVSNRRTFLKKYIKTKYHEHVFT